ncbi:MULTISPECIES: DUF4279 domain-containing protein [Bacillaceae]|uniref:DUF4279 domain-containing protein n=1 Tax=Evansella alkalicola TaxID=745819 RepID=A0ABS6JNK1_9BACI|nr:MULTISPECIES: DUF4279 domain-containing protein [Bacillaceae]MBU9720125.1 DUF4279 domain-containing protein [Bacillus alkalicola]
MYKETTIEAYLCFFKNEPHWDFPLETVTGRLGVTPTNLEKIGDWANQKRQYVTTEWRYSTGLIETWDFEMVIGKIVDTFRDKVEVINELKRELGIETALRVVTHVVNEDSPSYVIPIDVMKFAISIDNFIDIDQYIYVFLDEETDS